MCACHVFVTGAKPEGSDAADAQSFGQVFLGSFVLFDHECQQHFRQIHGVRADEDMRPIFKTKVQVLSVSVHHFKLS